VHDYSLKNGVLLFSFKYVVPRKTNLVAVFSSYKRRLVRPHSTDPIKKHG